MRFTTSRPLSLELILNSNFSRYPLEVIRGVSDRPSAYVCARGCALRVELDQSGYCFFSIPRDGRMPWFVFSALEHALDCTFERDASECGSRSATAEHRQAVVKGLDQIDLKPSARASAHRPNAGV